MCRYFVSLGKIALLQSITLCSSPHDNSGRQNCILFAVETVSVGRSLILGGNSGECFLQSGTVLHLGHKQVQLGHASASARM